MLINRARVRPGEDVLVMAAGSGVGSYAVQIAKAVGARVIATAGTDDKLQKAREIGADEVINHYTEDIVAGVRALTAGQGVDVIVEHVGSAVWQACFRSCLHSAANLFKVTIWGTTRPLSSTGPFATS